jgi:mRNA-degrading endonuclease toxin of MazEF toxin-antitoxin module
MSLRRGQIVWAEVLDPQGRARKLRPLVVVSETPVEGAVTAVAITTKIDQAPPADCVELPWHRDGHPRTGLKARSVAVCTWVDVIQVTDVLNVAGRVPDDAMLQIMSRVAPPPSGS